jgi:hypothetical protein
METYQRVQDHHPHARSAADFSRCLYIPLIEKGKSLYTKYVHMPSRRGASPAQARPGSNVLIYSALAETGLTSMPYFSLSRARLRSSYPGGLIPELGER